MEERQRLVSIDFDKNVMPDGKNSLSGMGEELQLQAFTGVGTYKIPLPIPRGRKLTPDVALQYSSANGNGVFGLGFTGPEQYITRLTCYGIPSYEEGQDCFAMDDGVCLLEVSQETDENGTCRKVYRPETESMFHRIEYFIEPGKAAYWKVTTAEHRIYYYGIKEESTIAGGEGQIFRWYLDLVEGENGEKIRYGYEKHQGSPYLTSISYANYLSEKGIQDQFAYQVCMDYGDWQIEGERAFRCEKEWPVRNDVFHDFRAGFPREMRYLCRNILIFHNFTEDFRDGPILVRSVSVSYKQEPEVSLLAEIQVHGNVYREGAYIETEHFPSLQLSYQQFDHEKVRETLLENEKQFWIRSGRDVQVFFVDLYGEGIPGILTIYEDYAAYAANRGDGRFADPVVLDHFPIHSLADQIPCTLRSLEGNAAKQLVSFGAVLQGYYPFEAGKWGHYRPFQTVPAGISREESHFVDINGRGMSDLVVWDLSGERIYVSEGEKGFGRYQRGEPFIQIPAMDQEIGIYFGYVKVFGDGLYHKLMIRDGEMACWPNIGYGHVADQRWLGRLEQIDDFQSERVYFADLSGSGTEDLIYAEDFALKIYFNRNGSFERTPYTIALSTPFTREDSLLFADLYGQGCDSLMLVHRTERVVCHVWDFAGGRKPYLLTGVDNHMGNRKELTYDSSVRLYLRDKEAGRAWEYLPRFPVQVVTQLKHIDEIGDNEILEQYCYRNSYYDNVKKRFCGFRDVQYSKQFGRKEYCQDIEVHKQFYTGNPLESGIEKSHRECLALSGRIHIEEQYGIENGCRRPVADWRKEYTYHIRELDGKGSYLCREESCTEYRKDGTEDARISQRAVLSFDRFGYPVLSCQIYYPRKASGAEADETAQWGQDKTFVEVSRNAYIHLEGEDYALGIPMEEKRISYKDLKPQEGEFFSMEELRALFGEGGSRAEGTDHGMMAWKRQIYWDAKLHGSLEFGGASTARLLHHEEIAVLPAEDCQRLYQGRLAARSFEEEGGYWLSDGYYWRKGETCYYSAEKNAYMQAVAWQYEDGLDRIRAKKILELDRYGLFYTKKLEYVKESLAGISHMETDYTSGQPARHCDVNGNETTFSYNGFGELTAVSVHGNAGDTAMDMKMTWKYARDRWKKEKQPLQWIQRMITWENGAERLLEETCTYINGMGEEIQKKTRTGQAEYLSDGWKEYDGEGNIVRMFAAFDSDSDRFERPGQRYPVEQRYYDSDRRPYKKVFYRRLPETAEYYTVFEKTEYTPWMESHYDVSDVGQESEYFKVFTKRWQQEHRKEWEQEHLVMEGLKVHFGTPSVRHFNSRGQEEAKVQIFRSGNDGEATRFVTREYRDWNGNCQAVELPVTYGHNARRRAEARVKSLERIHDLEGRLLCETNRDTGEKRCFYNAQGLLKYEWNGMGVRTEICYDWMGRQVQRQTGRICEKYTYGESSGLPPEEIQKRNLWGNPVVVQFQTERREQVRYDCFGRCLEEKVWIAGEKDSFSFRYSYDPAGRLRCKVLPDQSVKYYTYDLAGRLIQTGIRAEDDVSAQAEIRYQPFGAASYIRLDNGLVHSRVYDEVTHMLIQDVVERSEGEGRRLIWKDHFHYDLIGNPVCIEELDGDVVSSNTVIPSARVYTYDSLYRLEKASGRRKTGDINDPGQVERYEEQYGYDGNGNLIWRRRKCSQGFEQFMQTEEDSNRCIRLQGRSGTEGSEFSYDAAGNLQNLPGISRIVWNDAGLAAAFHVSDSEMLSQTQTYAGNERRIKETRRKLGEALWDVEQILYLDDYQKKRVWRERQGEKELLAEYDSVSVEADSEKIIVFVRVQEDRFARKKRRDEDRRQYISGNYQGSAVLMTDMRGAVVVREEHYPYGGTAYVYSPEASRAEQKQYGYMGKERDGGTGLYYFGARYYAPYMMRWISPDTMEADGYNLYCFVGCNPVTYTDKTGHAKTLARIGEMRFRENDLLYGLSGDPGRDVYLDEIFRQTARQIGGTQGFPVRTLYRPATIDEYNNTFLGTWVTGREGFRGKVMVPGYYQSGTYAAIQKYADHLTQKRRDMPRGTSLSARNERVRISCLEGMRYTRQIGGTIHYILDGIDLNTVMDPLAPGFTNEEIRFIYNNWNELKDTVIFYRAADANDPVNTLQQVQAPWIGNEEAWESAVGPLMVRGRAVA